MAVCLLLEIDWAEEIEYCWTNRAHSPAQPSLPGYTPALLAVLSPPGPPAAHQAAHDAGEGNLELLVCHHVDYRIQRGVEITCNDHLVS